MKIMSSPFAEPSVLVLLHGVCHSYKMSLACGFKKNVVALAIEIFAIVHDGLILFVPIVDLALARRGLAILRMEPPQVCRQAGQRHVVNGEIEAIGADFALVGESEARCTSERHFEIRIQRLDGRHGQQFRLVDVVFAEAEAEEIADGNFDRRCGLAIPPSAQHEVLQMHRIGRVDGEPEVRDDPCTGDVEQGSGLARLHGHRVVISTCSVPTR
jgi:hypothetical protein